MLVAEQQLPPERIKELATAAIVKRTQSGKKSIEAKPVSVLKARKTPRALEVSLAHLVKDLSEFYGFAAVPRSTKEHRLMAEIVAENWVPLDEFERQVLLKEQAQARVAELKRENADLQARIEQRIQEIPRLRAVIRSAVARLIVDSSEKHVREEWAVLLLRHIEAARELLQAELSSVDERA